MENTREYEGEFGAMVMHDYLDSIGHNTQKPHRPQDNLVPERPFRRTPSKAPQAVLNFMTSPARRQRDPYRKSPVKLRQRKMTEF